MASLDVCWFPEPDAPDPTFARRTEDSLSWLRRSTLTLAVEYRRFLNFNLAQLPEGSSYRLARRLREGGDHWRSALFELIVARTLQALGADLEVEPELTDARQPDFKARFGSTAIIVEATAPFFHREVQRAMGRKDVLAEIIEELTPDGWIVWINELPELGPADSKRSFRRTCEALLDVPPPRGHEEQRRLVAAVDSGPIDLTLLVRKDFSRRIAGGPGQGWSGDGVETIRRAVKRKRRQVRESGSEVVLAINASELFSGFEDFDWALFGHTHGHYDAVSDSVRRVEFVADGVLTTRGKGAPTIAAVLAYVEANCFCSREPVLYVHPRFQGKLPSQFEKFERRILERDHGIQKLIPTGPPVLQALEPVRREVLGD